MPRPPIEVPRRAEVVTAVLIGRVGDTLTAGPCLRALRARFPEARLRLVAAAQSRQAAELLPWLDERLYLARLTKARDNVLFAYNLLKGSQDVVVDLNPAPSKTSTAIVASLRAQAKIGFEKERFDGVFDLKAARPRDDEPMLERYRRLARALGAPYEPRLEVALTAEHEAWAAGARAPEILIHCGNFKKFDNRWPEDKLAALGRALRAEGRDIAWLAGPGEFEATAAIAEEAGGGSLFTPPSLGATGALMKRASVVVGSITGTTHLAHAVGARTFGLYAGYTNAVWRPADERAGGIVSADWRSCRGIAVDEALTGLRAFLAQAGKR